MSLKYSRVLLKLSGEARIGFAQYGIVAVSVARVPVLLPEDAGVAERLALPVARAGVPAAAQFAVY